MAINTQICNVAGNSDSFIALIFGLEFCESVYSRQVLEYPLREREKTHWISFFENYCLDTIRGFESRAQREMSFNELLNKSMVLILQLQAESMKYQQQDSLH